MKRTPGLRAKMDALLAQAASVPLVWGAQDCGIGFVAEHIIACTGKDVAAPFRGRYTTALGAVRVLKAEGFDRLDAVLAAHFEAFPASLGQLGDVACIATDDPLGCALGIVTGAHIAVRTNEGLGFVPLTAASKVFRIE